MRILGFGKKWPKLQKGYFTTFRFARKDKDWGLGEVVQVVYRPRSKEREVLGFAQIMDKQARRMGKHGSSLPQPLVTDEEAREDGFADYFEMWEWLFPIYGGLRLLDEPMNKLVLVWVQPLN